MMIVMCATLVTRCSSAAQLCFVTGIQRLIEKHWLFANWAPQNHDYAGAKYPLPVVTLATGTGTGTNNKSGTGSYHVC